MLDVSDLICGTYMDIHPAYMPIKCFACVTHVPSLVGIIISHIYLAITCEVDNAVGYTLGHLCKNVESIYPCSILAV